LHATGAAGISILGGCQTSGDSNTHTSTSTPTKTPTSAPTDTPTSTPTETATPEPDDLLEDMEPYEQTVNDMWDRIDVNENVRRDVQNMFSDGKEIEALEETMQHGAARAGFSSPAFYDSEKEYKTSGAVQAVARAVELYREDDPDNTQEALGLHRLNVDVNRVLLDGVESDIAIAEDTLEDETVLATKVNVAPGEEGPDADAYRVGTEPEGYTQEILKGLTQPDDPRGFSPYDLDSMLGVTEGDIDDIDTQTNAENHSKVWPDLEAGANTIHEKILNTSTVPQRVMITMDYLRDISDQGYLGMDRIREHTEAVQQASPAEDETIVVGLGQDGLETQTVNYDYSRGFVENLSQL